MTATVLGAHHLVRTFGDFTAVSSVSFEVSPGEVVGLLGANGAGKTTTIRMLVGLLAPSSGVAHLLGRPPDRSGRARLGYVPQGLGLYGDMTVDENLEFIASVYQRERSPIPDQLAAVRTQRVDSISLGLQRQLAFVGALQHEPDVLVLDEPTSGVGPLASARLWDDIRGAAEAGAGVLVSTHSMLEARQCDRLLLMAGGRVVARGTEADIVGDLRAVEVTTTQWRDVFQALSVPGSIVTLDGRSVRVLNQGVADVLRRVAAIDPNATADLVAATIGERMASLATG